MHASPADPIRAALIADSQRHAAHSGRWRESARYLWQYCLCGPDRRVRKLGDKAKDDGPPLGLAAALHGWKLNAPAHHPTSGAPIAGQRLPHWDAVRDLVVRSHRSFPGRRVVGWDIAITAYGPVIVEGNVAPGLDLIQRTQGPLGRSRLGELLAWHVEDRASLLAAATDASADSASDARTDTVSDVEAAAA